MAVRKTRQTTQHTVLIACQPTTGGVARHVIDLSEGLAARGWDVMVACPLDGWLAERIQTPPVKLVELPMVREIKPIPDLAALLRLYRLCRQVAPEVLHVHSSKAGFLGRVAGAAARVPVIIYTPHCWSFELVTGRKQRLYARLERFASRFCTMTVTVSQKEIDDAVELGVLDRSQTRMTHNGVRSPTGGHLPHETAATLDGPGPLVVTVGRPDEQKGHANLLDAMKIVRNSSPQARLAVAGDGPLIGELRERTRAMGLATSIFFLGEMKDVGPLLARADLFVLSSLWGEGSPYTVLEAMAAGLAVVTTDVGGCPELVRDGVTGLVVPPNDPDALAGAILALLEDDSRRTAMGAAGRQVVLRDYTIERLIDTDEALYLELLGQRGTGSIS